MLTLTLMRHGKAEVGSPTGEDVDRPLAPRGERAAIMAGKILIERGLRPDLVLCSSARRTRETLDGLRGSLPDHTKIRFAPDLYLAEADLLLEVIQGIDRPIKSVLVVGHNPGLHQFAVGLVGSAADRKELSTLSSRFPTSGLAIISFGVDSWGSVGLGCGRLDAFDLSARVG